MNNDLVIQTSALSKRFSSAVALQGIDWSLEPGRIVALVGRNGSGKSTLLQAALGLVLPSEGECRTLGVRAGELTETELCRIGYVDQNAGLLEWLTVEQHLRYVAALQPHWDVQLENRFVDDLGLDRKQRIAGLSKGMHQRLAILLAVCHRPKLLLLDEPVSGLDPQARGEVLRLLLDRVVDDGATVVISSHVLHDIEKIADHVLCLDAGRVIEDTSLDLLKESVAEWVVTRAHGDLPFEFSEPFILGQSGGGRRACLAVRASEEDQRQFCERHRVTVERRALDLEQIFTLLTGAGKG